MPLENVWYVKAVHPDPERHPAQAIIVEAASHKDAEALFRQWRDMRADPGYWPILVTRRSQQDLGLPEEILELI